MQAFLGNERLKAEILSRVLAHRKADEIIKGRYWEDGKGCAVGCTIHGSEHFRYETELGIPIRLAYLEDSLFENMPNNKAVLWPEEFLSAISPGADLSKVWYQFQLWILIDKKHGMIRFANKAGKIVIQKTAKLYQRAITGKIVSVSEWYKVSSEAARAARAARAERAVRAAWEAREAEAARAAGAAGTSGTSGTAEVAYIQSRELLRLLKAALVSA